MINDSYKKINNEIQMYEAEKMALPKGYIRKKTISGKEYTYLQYREGDKVRSVYIDKKKAKETEKEIAERKRIKLWVKYGSCRKPFPTSASTMPFLPNSTCSRNSTARHWRTMKKCLPSTPPTNTFTFLWQNITRKRVTPKRLIMN